MSSIRVFMRRSVPSGEGQRQPPGSGGREGEPITVPDLAKAPNYPLRDLVLSAGFHSVLVVPLLGQSETLGALVLQRRAVGDFPAGAIGLMRTFAHQSALAMNNARLFREVEQSDASWPSPTITRLDSLPT